MIEWWNETTSESAPQACTDHQSQLRQQDTLATQVSSVYQGTYSLRSDPYPLLQTCHHQANLRRHTTPCRHSADLPTSWSQKGRWGQTSIQQSGLVHARSCGWLHQMRVRWHFFSQVASSWRLHTHLHCRLVTSICGIRPPRVVGHVRHILGEHIFNVENWSPRNTGLHLIVTKLLSQKQLSAVTTTISKTHVLHMYDTIRFTHTVDPNGHLYMICRCPAFSRCSMQSKCAFLSIAQENHFQREMKSTSQATMISDVVISFIFFAIISSNKNHISVFLRSTNHHRFQGRNPFKENHLFQDPDGISTSHSPFNQPIPKGIQPHRTLRECPGCPVGLKMCWICCPCFLWELKLNQEKIGSLPKKKCWKTYGTKLSFQNLQSIFQCLRYIPLIGQGTFRKDKKKTNRCWEPAFLDDTAPAV